MVSARRYFYSSPRRLPYGVLLRPIKKRRSKSAIPIVFGVALILAVAGSAYLSWGPLFAAYAPHDSPYLAYHVHAHLAIRVNGVNITIPANIGGPGGIWVSHRLDRYGVGGWAPIHTHTESGVLHVESNTIYPFTLGDFFDIWGKTFTQTPNTLCALDYCTPSYTIHLFVDGDPPAPNVPWRAAPLSRGTEIFITISASIA